MFHREPEGHYRCTKSMVIVPFWFSLEQHWTALTPFWLSAKDMQSIDQKRSATSATCKLILYNPLILLSIGPMWFSIYIQILFFWKCASWKGTSFIISFVFLFGSLIVISQIQYICLVWTNLTFKWSFQRANKQVFGDFPNPNLFLQYNQSFGTNSVHYWCLFIPRILILLIHNWPRR